MREVLAHHKAEEYIDAYLEAAGIAGAKKTPLFRSFNERRQLTQRRLHRSEVWGMIKRRARKAGRAEEICCHTFRATGITTYLENGGTIERAQQIAAHESPRTTSCTTARRSPSPSKRWSEFGLNRTNASGVGQCLCLPTHSLSAAQAAPPFLLSSPASLTG
jgi:integrase